MISDFIGKQKFVFAVGYGYFGAMGMGFLVASKLQEYYPFNRLPIYILFPLAIFGVWVIGFTSLRLKWYESEAKHTTKANPIWNEMHKKVTQDED